MADGERLSSPQSPERRNDLAEAAGEQLEKLKKTPENSAEQESKSQERAIEHARKQAELEAVFGKETSGESKQGGEPSAPATKKAPSKQTKQREYQKTMASVQTKLTPTARTFSKVIHTPAVEKTSEVVGSTVARPNMILMGSLFAFVAVLGVYLLAKHNGFRLTGFETIGAFVAGWLVGAAFDILRVAFAGRRRV